MSIVNQATGPKAAHRVIAQPQETKTAQEPAEETTSTDFGEAVEITLSDAAEDGAIGQRPGKAAYSAAHQARAFLAERAALAEGEGGEAVPFGQIVSRIARGIDPAEAFAPPVVDETGTAEGTEETEAAAGDEAEEAAEETTETTTAPAVESGEAVVAELLDELIEEDEEENA